MATTLETKLKIESWDEQPYRELEEAIKLVRADVVLTGTDDQVEAATFEALMYCRADGTSRYLTQLWISANLDGRTGTFVMQGTGNYDGTTARGESEIVAGSGTGQLAGISGTGLSSSTQSDYPFMPLTLSYQLG